MRLDSSERLAPYSSAALRPSATCRTPVEPMQNLHVTLGSALARKQTSTAAAARAAPAGLLHLLPQLLELVVPHVLILKDVDGGVPGRAQARVGLGTEKREVLPCKRMQTHVSTRFLIAVIMPSFHSFVFFFTLVRDTAGTTCVSNRRLPAACFEHVKACKPHQAYSFCFSACF